MTNSKLLRDAINNKGLKLKFVASKLNLSPVSLSQKINNDSEFKSSEIILLCDLLDIDSLEKKEAIFFNSMVD